MCINMVSTYLYLIMRVKFPHPQVQYIVALYIRNEQCIINETGFIKKCVDL